MENIGDFVIAVLISFSNKCGTQYKTDIHTGFKTELECKQYGERQYTMYLRTNKTNVKSLEYVCYKRN